MPRARALLHAACLFGLAILVMLAFEDVLGPGRGLTFRDHFPVFRPWFRAAAEAFREGRIPTLTHASAAGVPLELTFSPIYTPPMLILLFGSFDVAYDWFVLSHFLILAAGAYVLATSLGARPIEAFAAGAVAALSGPVLSLENLLGALPSLAYAPWVYWTFLRLLRAPSLPRAAWLAIAVGFHVQVTMPELVLLDVVAALAIVLHVRPQPSLRLAVTGVLAAVLGVAIAAVKLVPLLLALPATRRGHGFSYAEASAWAMHLPQLLELFVPSPWAPPELPFASVPAAIGRDSAYLTSLYFGATTAIAAAACVVKETRRHALFALFGVALAIAAALGPATPLHRALHALPLLASARFPIKYVLFVSAFMAVLVPLGVRAWRASPRALVVTAGLVFAFQAACASASSSPELAAYLETFAVGGSSAFFTVSSADVAQLLLEALRPRLFHATAFALVLLVVSAWPVITAKRAELAAWLLVVVAALDLALAGRFTVLGVDLANAPPANVVEHLQSPHHRVFHATVGTLPGGPRRAPGATLLEDEMASELRRGRFPLPGVRWFEQMDRDGAGNPASKILFEAIQRVPADEAKRALGRAGVAWLTSWLDEGAPGQITFPVEGEAPHYVVPIAEVRPYVAAYTEWIDVRPRTWTVGDFRRYFLSERFRDVALLDDLDPATPTVKTATISGRPRAACGAPNVVLDPSTREDLITAEVTTACDAVVVVLETKMPGWIAEVDGTASPIVEAELGNMGVRVPSGSHRVTFAYEAESPRWLPVSAFALLASLLVGLAPLTARRR